MQIWRSLFLAVIILAIAPAHASAAESLFKKSPSPRLQQRQTPPAPPSATAPSSGQPGSQNGFPDLISITPSSIAQGRTGTVMLNGRHLNPSMQLDAGRGVTFGQLQPVTDTMLRVEVSVSPQARPGARLITVRYKERSSTSRARLTVTAAPQQTSLTALTPNTLMQGQNRVMQLSGTGLDTIRNLSFGPGITLGKPENTRTGLRLTVTAAPDATPGNRILTYSDREGRHTSRLRLTISPKPAPTPPPAPVVRQLTPNRWEQGKSYEVRLTGANLPASLQVRFGTGITILQTGVTSSAAARLKVRVEPGTAPGAHRMELRTGPDTGWQKSAVSAIVTATVPPPAAVKPDTDTTMSKPSAPKPPQAAPSAHLTALTPRTWTRGSTQTVTIQGKGLSEIRAIRFAQGISISGWHPTSASSTTVTVTVAPDARLGAHLLQTRTSGQAPWQDSALEGLVVTDKAQSPKKPERKRHTLAAPVAEYTLTGMNPGRWYPGRTYRVTVAGAGIDQNTFIRLGPGVSVSDLVVVSAHLATMTVTLAADAAPGLRRLQTRRTGQDDWSDSGLQGLVLQVFAQSTPPLVAQPALADMVFSKGAIHLETPEFGKFLMMENAIGDHGIPKTTDATRFTWTADSPGQSQWFELRIVDRQGNVRMKRTVNGQPLPDQFYIPDAAFIAELFDMIRQQNQSGQTMPALQTSVLQSLAPSGAQPSAPQSEGSEPLSAWNTAVAQMYDPAQYVAAHADEVDCFWEVAGFRRITTQTRPQTAQSSKNGGSKAKPVVTRTDVEVAISERWPLRLPAFSPSGLACSMANTELTYDKIDFETGQPVSDHTLYVGDMIQVSGTITLDECPWALAYDIEWGELTGAEASYTDPQTGETVPSTFGSTPVTTWVFKNAFIEWGDGTYERLRAAPSGSPASVIGEATTGSDVPPTGTISLLHTHRYHYSAKFPVRVFVLPIEDAGTIGSIAAMNKAPNPSSTQVGMQIRPSGGNLLLATGPSIVSDVAPQFNAKAMSASVQPTVPEFQPPGGRAFLLYCNPQIIDIKADPDALGPLHLENIEITSFSGQESTGQQALSLPQPPAQTIPIPHGLDQQGSGAGGNSARNMQLSPAQPSGSSALMSTSAQSASLVAGLHTAVDAYASTCDAALYATATLTYYGMGSYTLRWKVDGQIIGEALEDIGPSPLRSELGEDNTYAEDIRRGTAVYTSPALPLTATEAFSGKHTVTVEAELDPEDVTYSMESHIQGGQILYEPVPNMAAMVVSEPKTYAVQEPGPGEPCIFRFPVADGGYFLISGLRGRAHKQGGTWSGQGTLLFDLPDSPGSAGRRFVDIPFQNWTVTDDGEVTSGRIQVQNLAQTYDQLPGVRATLRSLQGEAGGELMATLDLEVKDNSLRVVESGGSSPPAWSGISAPLRPEDGWYADGQSLPLTQIGWSLCQIESPDVRLDLSHKRGINPAPFLISALTPGLTQPGPAPGALSTDAAPGFTDASWVGVHLGTQALLHPYLFNLADLTVPAPGWALTDNGLSGHSHFGAFSNALGQGRIEFDGIDITSRNNAITADYTNVRVVVPWPSVTLQGGNAHLEYTQGALHAGLNLQFDTTGLSVTEDYGKVAMTSDIKEFQRRASGWGILTDTRFTFRDEYKDVTTVDMNDMFFSMYGTARFAGDKTSQTTGLNANTRLGDVEANLHSLRADAATAQQGTDRLAFTFRGDVDFPGLPAADVDVMYAVTKPLGASHTASGPRHSPFTTSIAYPDADPMATFTISPELQTSGNGLAGGAMLASLDPIIVADASGTGYKDTFTGKVNTQMFGISGGVEATFRYGASSNGQGYWLTHCNKSGLHIPIFSGVVLDAINGGLGYGFSANAFTNGNPLTASPDNPGKMLYSAGVTVGSAAPDIFKLTGQLTVIPEDVVCRMAFHNVVLLGETLNGGGFFEYGNRAFRGKVWGELNLYKGAVRISAPQGADDDLGSVGMLFNSNDWQFYLGRRFMPVNVHFLIADVNGYMHLGKSVGARIGGNLHASSGKQCFGIGAAEAYVGTMVDIAVSPSVHLDADFTTEMGMNVWVPSCSGKKFHFGRSFGLHVEALPVHLKGVFTVDCGRIFGSKTFRLTLI